MPKITEHFSLSEFACKDGTPYPDKWIKRLELLCENLEIIREAVGKPLIITSGFRTPSWNRKVGGARQSQHLEGRAADFRCAGLPATKLYKIVRDLMDKGRLTPGGLGQYSGFVHYDIRGNRASWSGSRGIEKV